MSNNTLRINLEDYENGMPIGELRAVINSITVPENGKASFTYNLTLLLPGRKQNVFVNVFANQVHELLLNLYDNYELSVGETIDLEEHIGTEVLICVHTQVSTKGKPYYVLTGYKPVN